MDDVKEIAYITAAAAFGIALAKLGFGIIASWNIPILSWIAQGFTEAMAIV